MSALRVFSSLAILTLSGISLGLQEEARAATRAVFFSGSSSIPYLSGGFADSAKVAYCSITIVNLSTSSQRIESVEFLMPELSGATVRTRYLPIASASEQLKVEPDALEFSAASQCIGRALPRNSYCTLMKRVTTIPVAGIRNAHCSGKVTVSDVNASQPGSVVASGSVVTLQEVVVLGGVLSAAHYYGSPNDVALTTAAAKFDDLPSNRPSGLSTLRSGSAGSGGGTGQMNLSCYANCIERVSGVPTPDQQSACRAACGVPSPPPAAPAPDNSDTLNKYVRSAVYSGGVVHEMTIGPFLSICSGNAAYHAEGGIEFSHADLHGGQIGILNTVDSSGGIPERLYCMHRHGNDDLYSRVGATSAFAINGGSPF
jgi:hypothetical protein